jgi:hypothetical protein
LVRLPPLILQFIKSDDKEARKQRYINRHKNNETWSKSGTDTAEFWSRWLLWNLPTKKDSYMESWILKEDSIYSILLICILNKQTY